MNLHSVPASALRRDREKQERRSAILTAAERVVIGRGFAEASMDGIAREAGLAAGTVYLYFPNKEALFQELLGSKIRELNAAVAAETSRSRGFAAALSAVVLAMFRHFQEHQAFFEIFVRERVEFSRGTVHAEMRFREIEAGAEQMARWMAEAQRRGELGKGRPKLLATALRGLVFQFTRDWLRGGAEGRLTQHAPFVTNFFLKGAAS